MYAQLQLQMEMEPIAPTIIICCVSGGKDSVFALLQILKKYPIGGEVRVIVHHQVVLEDWPGTVEYNQRLCEQLGVPLVIEQALYYGFRCRVCGGKYLSAAKDKGQGKCPVVVQKRTEGNIRCRAVGQGELVSEINSLTSLMNWREAGPSPKTRYCTSYLKRDVFNKFARRERQNWGERPVVVLGERWAESPGRAKLPYLTPRSGMEWLLEWHPILHYRRIEVFRGLRAAGIEPHPCYKLQGMTESDMFETDTDGGARCSCRCCFYLSPEQLAVNANLPGNEQLFRDVVSFETTTGYTLKPGLSMQQILDGKRSTRTIKIR